jgi:branched-chain amino acid transport system ATP-binding protein
VNPEEYALRLINVRKSFGVVDIIRGVTLDVRRGERHALIGPNGAGKSTLFALITGRLPVSSGAIELNGKRIENQRPFQIYRQGLSRSFQVTNIFQQLSVFENIRCVLLWSCGWRYNFWRSINRLPDIGRRADDVIEQIGLGSRRNSPAGLLTYAEQRALEIGLTIAGNGELLLFDEPTAGMSQSESQQAVELIRRVSHGKTLLMIEHDMNAVFSLADRISVLVYGQIIATGTPSEVRANPKVIEAYLGDGTELHA